MTKMRVEFDVPDADDAGPIAMAIEDAVSDYGVDEIEWDTD